jgi:transcriptional regulator with XRE-family HTH domain
MLKDVFKKLREKAGISQQEVATKAGLSWSLIAQIEQGKKIDVRVSTLLGIAKALGVDAGVLLAAFAEASEVAGGDGDADVDANAATNERVKKQAKRNVKAEKGNGRRKK